MTTNLPDPLRSRRRLAEEWLLESSSWRDNLDDVQAQRLMNWAREHVNQVIEQTAVLSDDEVEVVIEDAITAVLRVMDTINNLVPTLSQLDDAAAQQKLQDFSVVLQPIPLPPITQETIGQIIAQRQTWDTQTTFDTLFQMLIWQIEEETEEKTNYPTISTIEEEE
jgi:hypothetical protein